MVNIALIAMDVLVGSAVEKFAYPGNVLNSSYFNRIKGYYNLEKDIGSVRVVMAFISWPSAKVEDRLTFGVEYLGFCRHICFIG